MANGKIPHRSGKSLGSAVLSLLSLVWHVLGSLRLVIGALKSGCGVGFVDKSWKNSKFVSLLSLSFSARSNLFVSKGERFHSSYGRAWHILLGKK